MSCRHDIRVSVTLVAMTLVSLVTGENVIESFMNNPVTVPPLIVEEAAKIIAYQQFSSIDIPCVASGIPDPEYSWTMNEKAFDPSGTDDRVFILPGLGTLNFTQTLDRDEGYYQCTAQNLVGAALSVKVDLRLAFLDAFQSSTNVSHYPNLGDSLTLTCTPPASFPAPLVSWATIAGDGQLLPVELNARVMIDPIGNLHFVNIMQEDHKDGQTYACVVQNHVTHGQQQGEYSRVYPSGENTPYVPMSLLWADPSQQVALRNDTWRVKCIFSGNPTPNVTWRRIGAEMPEGRWDVQSYGMELVIQNVQYEDQGTYECEGTNDGGVPIRKSFVLYIESAPSWLSRPQSVEGSEGEMAIFHCQSDGIPQPVNFWHIDGILVSTLPDDPNRLVEENKITFFNITEAYSQVIQCNSTNRHGHVYANAYLNVLPPPEEQVVHSDHRSAGVIWTPDKQNPTTLLILLFFGSLIVVN